ncbi:hypothetical protein [Synechococcus sp. LA31]|uniref:hypothetical protein n=1 Tax=Synechococcus sp. LA31 TaxID=2741953 RepID=UPI001BDC1BE7|nr:hypothetical protein [Synechococcus sp. LA31]QVV66758.1 hypothetical protein KJJ24_09700 [Synechococcus sp. LA31]
MSKTATKPIPAYLKPELADTPQPEVVYEPPLAIGTQVRMGPFRSLEERTFRYEHAKTGEPMELVSDQAEAYEIAGFQDVDHWTFNRETQEFELGGTMRCPYAVTGEERPYDFEAHLQEVLQADYFKGICERDEITDPEAYLRANHLRFMRPSNEWTGRKYFQIGEGQFHSALIGGEWIPVVRGSVRTKTQPVLGWALESARQTSFKGDQQAKGHRGEARDAKGRLVRESEVVRRRWTTTLAVDALAELDRISAETGQHRNEIVEALILGAATPAPEPEPPAAPAADITGAELAVVIGRLCAQHGADWPRGMASELARRASISKQSISQRKQQALAAQASAQGLG